VLRLDGESFFAGVNGLAPVLLLSQGDGEVSIGTGIVRFEFDGLAEALDGLAMIFQVVAQQGTEADVRAGVFRVEFGGMIECCG
jgi:hypothetical protein